MKKIWIGISALLALLVISTVAIMFVPGSYASATNIDYTDMLKEDGVYIVYADDCTHCIADEPEATKLVKSNSDVNFKSINFKVGVNTDMNVYSSTEALKKLGYVENGTPQDKQTFDDNLVTNNIGQTDPSQLFITGTPAYFAVKNGTVVGYESGAGQLNKIIETYKGAE